MDTVSADGMDFDPFAALKKTVVYLVRAPAMTKGALPLPFGR